MHPAKHHPQQLGDSLILDNLKWLKKNCQLAKAELSGTIDRTGALSHQFIADRIFAVSGDRWSIDKVREFFGSRPKPPSYRWSQILTLTEALDVSVLDLILPNPDHEAREHLEGFASEAYDLPPSFIENRHLSGERRRYEELLELAAWHHPTVQALADKFELIEVNHRQLEDETKAERYRRHHTHYEQVDREIAQVIDSIRMSGYRSSTLTDLSKERPKVVETLTTDKGGTMLGHIDDLPTSETLLQILSEFGVLPTKEGS
jgi:hypothetical protein